MTQVQFTQRPPSAGEIFRGPNDSVIVIRGQRSVDPDGTVLLQGKIELPLVDSTCVGTIEPTKPGEYVTVKYHHREPYTRTVAIPDTTELVQDTDLLDVVPDEKKNF